jgi:hypothetical protein
MRKFQDGEEVVHKSDRNHCMTVISYTSDSNVIWCPRRLIGEFHPTHRSTMLLPPFAAGRFDEDAAHRFRGGGEEVSATIPVLVRIGPDEPDIGFVNQGRCVERLPRLLARHLACGQSAQLVIDQRQ